MYVYLLVGLSTFLGAVLQSVTGFGLGLVVITTLPFFLSSYSLCLALSTVTGFLVALFGAIRMRKFVEWRLMAAPVSTYLLINYFAVRLSSIGPDALLQKLLGGFLFLLSIYFIVAAGKIKIKPTFRNGLIAGGIGGILSGLFGTGGPPIAIYMLAASKDSKGYIANTQLYFACTTLIAIANRYMNGQLTMEVLPFTAVIIAAILLGLFIGSKIFNKLNVETLKKTVYVVIALSGLVLVLK